MVSELPARHILVILDSCHSGLALGGSFSQSRGDDRYLNDMSRNVSRTVITSAQGDQTAADQGPVPSHSLFTGLLMQGLQTGKAENDGKGWVSSLHLGAYVQHEVGAAPDSRQTPAFGSFYHGDNGDLVLAVPHSGPMANEQPAAGSFAVPNTPAGTVNDADKQEIQGVLDRYAAGFNQKDVKLIQAVWPSIPKEQVKNIRDFLKDRKTVNMVLSITAATAAGKRITVDCSQTLQFDDHGKEKTQTNPITLYVIKRDVGWEIDFIPNF